MLILPTLITLYSVAQTRRGQSEWNHKKYAIGLHFGGTFPTINKNTVSSYFKPEPGFSTGVILNLSPLHFLSIEVKPTINKVIYSFETMYHDPVTGDTSSNIKFMHSTTHFTLPVMVDLHNSNTVQGHLYTGLFYAGLVRAATNSDKSYYGQTHIDRTDEYSKKNKLGTSLGAGVTIHKPGTRVGINLQYLYNLYFSDTYLDYHNVSLNVLYHF